MECIKWREIPPLRGADLARPLTERWREGRPPQRVPPRGANPASAWAARSIRWSMLVLVEGDRPRLRPARDPGQRSTSESPARVDWPGSRPGPTWPALQHDVHREGGALGHLRLERPQGPGEGEAEDAQAGVARRGALGVEGRPQAVVGGDVRRAHGKMNAVPAKSQKF